MTIDTLCIELTLKCPLKCLHCSANALPERQEFVNKDNLLKRLTEVYGLKEIYFSGGEPFEHPSLSDFVSVARYSANLTIIYSSGVKIHNETIQSLDMDSLSAVLKSGVSRIDLSLYGVTERVHESVTNIKGSFNALIESITNIKRLGIPFGIHYVPIFQNNNEVIDVAYFAESVGAKRLHVLALAPQGRGSKLLSNTYNSGFLDKIQLLMSKKLDLEILLSSKIRGALGITEQTERDKWRTAFVDVKGFIYPGEGSRLFTLRSPLPLYSNKALTDILSI